MLKTLFGKHKRQPARLHRERREVVVAERAVPLVVREHARSTRMTLRIEPGGRALSMTVPPGLARGEIDRFLKRQDAWLRARLGRFSEDDPLRDGGRIAIRGIDHRITSTGKLRGLTRPLVIDGAHVLEVGGAPEHLKRRIGDFLKREARVDLNEAADRHAKKLGRQPKSITLRDTRSRWGSCSSDGSLSFSWRIVMAPPHVIDYLAAHEAAHLIEMNHGPRFWALCRSLCPRTDEAKAWLKANGTFLHALDFG